MESQRYVICRPLGGLNDMLVQIARADSYARRTRRKLKVDTESNPKFEAKLSDYFHCDNSIEVIPKAELQRYDDLECFPPELRGRISTYELAVDTVVPFRDRTSLTPVTFDFTQNYNEPVLVHHQPGGGLNSTQLFEKLRLNARLLAEVERRKALLGSNYSAVHIRDSDYETDWISQLAKLKKHIAGGRVFLATDNQKIALSAEFKVFELDAMFSINFQDAPITFDKNEQALIDLALMAEASEMYILKLSHSTVAYSGFSLLAKYLWSVRKIKREGLLGLLLAPSLFRDFQPGNNSFVRMTFFYLYWLPRMIRASKRSDLLGA